MSVIIFILILGILIFVHELGHFIVAKRAKIRVDEFAIGFPPRLFHFRKGGTDYSLNIIPFGGYVKIFGENPDEESSNPSRKDSFVNAKKSTQALVLVAGVTFNVIFAWILFALSFMNGFPVSADSPVFDDIKDQRVVVTSILNGSPAEESGVLAGDTILSIAESDGGPLVVQEIDDVSKFVNNNQDDEIVLTVLRGDDKLKINIVPEILDIDSENKYLGISMDKIGTVQLSFFEAFLHSFKVVGVSIAEITFGLFNFIKDIFVGEADFDNVAGPVGIVGLVDDAANFGLSYLLSFTAFISLHLAVLNLIPFPALDGGRLLFVGIEAIFRRPIPNKIVVYSNLIGFLLLISLMVIITVSDVAKLF